jgi:hypothetical protein
MRHKNKSFPITSANHVAFQAQLLSDARIQLAMNPVIDNATGALLEYPALPKRPEAADWIQSTTNEIGRLTQGVAPHTPIGTDATAFIPHTVVPAGRTPTYLCIVCEQRPLKAEKKHVHWTVGGNKIHYPSKVSSPTADLTTVKCLLNSTISTPGACMLVADVKHFYLNTPMERYEYMRIPVKFIPACILEQYKLTPLIHNGFVVVEIRKGIYGLAQAGILAYNRLATQLATHGYHPAKTTPGFFRHAT